MAKATDPVADLRAEERSIARRKAEHDVVQLDRAKVLLDQIEAASLELGGLADLILTPHVGAHLIALKLDVERALSAVASGHASVAATLAES